MCGSPCSHRRERSPPVSRESLDVAWFGLDALPVQPGADLPALVAAAVRSQGLQSDAVSRAAAGRCG